MAIIALFSEFRELRRVFYVQDQKLTFNNFFLIIFSNDTNYMYMYIIVQVPTNHNLE